MLILWSCRHNLYPEKGRKWYPMNYSYVYKMQCCKIKDKQNKIENNEN